MHPITVLVADDDHVNLRLLRALLEKSQCAVYTAGDGMEAWELLERGGEDLDVVVLDRNMPGLDGLGLLKRMKRLPRLHHVPVIMETALGEKTQILEGIEAGALYYVPKPLDPEYFISTVESAARVSRSIRGMKAEFDSLQQAVPLLERAEFQFRTLPEAQRVANLVAAACPDPENAVIGLTELLANAVEHGNLELGYAAKSHHLQNFTLRKEIARRLELPEYRDRRAHLTFHREPWGILLKVQDQGPGFDWRRYLELDQSRAFDAHGRGIPIARTMAFDSLTYMGNGSTVVATLLHPPPQA